MNYLTWTHPDGTAPATAQSTRGRQTKFEVTQAKPKPISQWPAWTWLIMLARRSEDKGLGDTVVHVIGDRRSENFKQWFKSKFGHDCGCSDRQQWLNRNFSYATDERIRDQ